MKKFILLALSLLSVTAAPAAVLQVYTGAGATIVDPSLALASGSIFAAHFDELDGDGNPTSTFDFAGKTIEQVWAAATKVGAGFSFNSGIRPNADAQSILSNGPEIYEQVYLFVFEGGTDPGSASSYGLFTAPVFFSDVTDPFNPDTVFPMSNQLAGTEAVGGFGSVTGGNQFQLVPEPSTALLGLLAALGLVARRRRD
jgi:hypothetical protein